MVGPRPPSRVIRPGRSRRRIDQSGRFRRIVVRRGYCRRWPGGATWPCTGVDEGISQRWKRSAAGPRLSKSWAAGVPAGCATWCMLPRALPQNKHDGGGNVQRCASRSHRCCRIRQGPQSRGLPGVINPPRPLRSVRNMVRPWGFLPHGGLSRRLAHRLARTARGSPRVRGFSATAAASKPQYTRKSQPNT